MRYNIKNNYLTSGLMHNDNALILKDDCLVKFKYFTGSSASLCPLLKSLRLFSQKNHIKQLFIQCRRWCFKGHSKKIQAAVTIQLNPIS